jgi:NADPH-dependent 2,4-dienoyl-CoA reductase/sulfur reductase-like enzyme
MFICGTESQDALDIDFVLRGVPWPGRGSQNQHAQVEPKIGERFDLAVIGAGPAGMEAALAAAGEGIRTVLIDSLPREGGQYYRKPLDGIVPSALDRRQKEGESLSERLERSSIVSLYNALVWAIFKEERGEGWRVALYRQDPPHEVMATALVLANGAYDTAVAFPGWTLPGVITSGAALILAKSQGVAPGKRVLVAGCGPLLLTSAAALIEAGVTVVGVYETSRVFPQVLAYTPQILGHPRRALEAAGYLGLLSRKRVPYRTGWSILEVRGSGQVEEATIGRVDLRGIPMRGTDQTVKVDTVVCGYGLTPNTGLARLAGCRMEYRRGKGGWVPERDAMLQSSLPGIYLAGDGAEIGGAEQARLEGRLAGLAVAGLISHQDRPDSDRRLGRLQHQLAHQRRFSHMLEQLFYAHTDWSSLTRDDTLVCRCEEIRRAEVRAAVEAGAHTLGEVKMVTRVGMGDCQGRICEGPVAAAIMADLARDGASPESVGHFSIRPPLHPLPLEFLAQVHFEETSGDGDG